MKARRAGSLVIFGFIMAFFGPVSVLAANYQSGSYGTCTYGSGCDASTIVTLPPASPNPTASPAAALEVNINLKDHQVIPAAGYSVVVTPLNGAGTSFAQVDFYIDGNLVHSQTPDEEGTVTWFWDVGKYPGTVIRVLVTGTDGQTVDHTFNVTIATGAAAPLAKKSSGATHPSIIQQIAATPQYILRSITENIGKLPRQIKYELPYFLFVILGADMLFLLIRTRHEVLEAKRLGTLLSRERQTAELKRTFLELISHYLRTPITIINGALELAAGEGAAKAAHNDALLVSATVDDLIEKLVKNAEPGPEAIAMKARRPWLQPSFYAPITLIGVAAFSFDYLARHAHNFSLGQINIIVQVVVFGSLSVLIYQALRYTQLKVREQAATQRVLDLEVTFNQERDQAIEYGATHIKKLADSLVAKIGQVQSAQARRIAADGGNRLQQVVDKLLVANQLQGSQSLQAYVPVEFSELMRGALASFQAPLAAKSIQLKVLHTAVFQAQSATLLIFVLQTILDNAIAYSTQGGEILVDIKLTKEKILISVVDHGTGIAEGKKFSLFQAFSKTEGAETFNHEGMGFSLYLDKLIMHYLVGDITVESTPQQGTSVTLSLPQPLSAS